MEFVIRFLVARGACLPGGDGVVMERDFMPVFYRVAHLARFRILLVFFITRYRVALHAGHFPRDGIMVKCYNLPSRGRDMARLAVHSILRRMRLLIVIGMAGITLIEDVWQKDFMVKRFRRFSDKPLMFGMAIQTAFPGECDVQFRQCIVG